jgi:hypothetical protein
VTSPKLQLETTYNSKKSGVLSFASASEVVPGWYGRVSNLAPNKSYQFTWYDTRSGQWLEASSVNSDSQGNAQLHPFPDGKDVATLDWAAKLILR